MGASNSKIDNIDIVINLLERVKDNNLLSAQKYRKEIIDNTINFEELKNHFKEDFDELYNILYTIVQKEPTDLNIQMIKELSSIGSLEFKNIDNNSNDNVNIIKKQKYKKGEIVRFINKNDKWEYAEIFKYNYDSTYDLRNPITLKLINNICENDLTVDLIEIQNYKDNDDISFYLDDKYNVGKIIKYNGEGNYEIKRQDSDVKINIHETKIKSLQISKKEENTDIFTDIFNTFTKGIVEKINEYKPEIKNLIDSGINYLNENNDYANLNDLIKAIENCKGLFLKNFINTINKDYISYYNNPTLDEVYNNFEKNMELSNTNSIKYDNIRNITHTENLLKFKSELFSSYDDIVYDIKFDFGEGFKSFFDVFEYIELYNLNNLEPEIKEQRLSYKITNSNLLLFYMSDNLKIKILDNKKLLRIKYKGFYIKSDVKNKFKEYCKLIIDFDNKLYFKSDGSILENIF